MKNTRALAIISMLALIFTSTSFAATREEKRVSDASDVLNQLARIPEKSIMSCEPRSGLAPAAGKASW